MPEYKFLTTWKLTAPLEAVYDAIVDTDKWSTWWKNIEKVEVLERGQSDGIGRVERFTFRTELPYKLQFTTRVSRNERPTCIEGQASGELEGLGRWTLTSEGGVTVVNYLWNVRTNRWWMNLLAPLARSFFVRNHDAVMRNGGIGLARYLHAELVELRHQDLRIGDSDPEPKPNLVTNR